MTNSDIFSLMGLGVSVIGIGFIYVEGVIKIRERITKLETKVEVFWRSVSLDAAKILHTPHEANKLRDDLLEKFVDGKIKRDELKLLINILKNIIEDSSLEFGERTAASNLLRAIEMQYQL